MGQPWLQLKLVKLILHYYTENSCELEGIYMLVSVRFNIEHLTLWIETSDRKRDNYFPLCLHCWSMLPTNHVTLKVIFLNIGPVSKQNLTINMIFVMILCVPNYDRYTLNRTSMGFTLTKRIILKLRNKIMRNFEHFVIELYYHQ